MMRPIAILIAVLSFFGCSSDQDLTPEQQQHIDKITDAIYKANVMDGVVYQSGNVGIIALKSSRNSRIEMIKDNRNDLINEGFLAYPEDKHLLTVDRIISADFNDPEWVDIFNRVRVLRQCLE